MKNMELEIAVHEAILHLTIKFSTTSYDSAEIEVWGLKKAITHPSFYIFIFQ